MGEIFPTNTPSTLAGHEGTRLEISIMATCGNEKHTCSQFNYNYSSNYRAAAAIFIVHVRSRL